MTQGLVNVLFYSNEADVVSYVLTGKWSLPMIRNALMKSVVFKDGIYESQPGTCITALKEALLQCGYAAGVENVIHLEDEDLAKIIRHTVPSKNQRWVMVEMPWGDITIGGDIPQRRVTKQTWMRDWCDEQNQRDS
jgi:hypothetical protein